MAKIDDAGTSNVELALILPTLAFLIFGGLAIGVAYKRTLELQYMGKEIAATAFRQCALKTSTETAQIVSACLEQVLAPAGGLLLQEYPGATVILTALKWDPAHVPEPPTLVAQRQLPLEGALPSEIREDDFSSLHTNRNKLLNDEGVLIYAEIKYHSPSPLPAVPASLSNLLRNVYVVQGL